MKQVVVKVLIAISFGLLVGVAMPDKQYFDRNGKRTSLKKYEFQRSEGYEGVRIEMKFNTLGALATFGFVSIVLLLGEVSFSKRDKNQKDR